MFIRKYQHEKQIKKDWTINLDIIPVHNNKFEALSNKNFSTIWWKSTIQTMAICLINLWLSAATKTESVKC